MYNKSLDTASIESMRKALAEVEMNESDRAKHYKGATPPEDMKNNRKGKGAQDMMKPADDAVANPAADEQDMVNKDAATMTANVKIAKKRRNDKDVGDKDIVEPGTPMKDPAVVKPAVKEDVAAVKQNKPLQKKLDKLYGPKKKKKANEEKEMVNIKPRWILDAYKEMYEDVDSGKAQHMLAPNERKDHADHMKKTHGVTTKFHGSDELSYHGTKQQVRKALDNHYGKGGDQKEFHPHIYEERTVDSGKAQHMLAPSERAMHAKHMMDRHSVKTKFHGSDELSYHGSLSNVKRALSNHYGGDISQAKDLHPIMMKNESVENIDELSMNKLGQYRDLAKADISRRKAKMKAMPTGSDAKAKLKKRKGFKNLAIGKMSYKAQTDKSLAPRGPGSDKLTDYDKKAYAMRPSGPNIKKQMAVTHAVAHGDYEKGMTPAKKR